ncbi:MAG: FtsW/RodA/SpoVE family cell cycle protein [Eubacterium sp.]|nr:FtsW/RodA/SpoVE family cell cycle protein [Eubacterium sp.]
MENLIIELSKYLMLLLFACYTLICFTALNRRRSEKHLRRILRKQTKLIFLIHLNAFAVIFAVQKTLNVLLAYVMQAALLCCIIIIYKYIYKRASGLIVNNMCMLLAIGFMILYRLNPDKAVRQYQIAAAAAVITLIIPFFIHRLHFLNRLTWIYALFGIALLLIVAVLGATSYGAKLSFKVAGIAIQPSEFVKILFVFYAASMLYQSTEFVQVVKATIVAAVHVLILVVSKDLGAALIFFITYLVMLYVATRKPFYLISGLACGSTASVVAYKLFRHVRVRVVAWKDPLSVIDNEGYQVCQSLFAIGTGGWFGMGLYRGMPNKIPIVEEDFVFAAVAEELGGFFAVCLIMVCVSCYLMFLNIAMQIHDQFYKLTALGLGTVYGFQVFLTIGGVTKFIPSTGVTLPLVSYGGSSLLSTFILFAIIQGLYILREDKNNSIDEEVADEEKSGRNRRKTKKKGRREVSGR